jgi:hypothetical protein
MTFWLAKERMRISELYHFSPPVSIGQQLYSFAQDANCCSFQKVDYNLHN